jgi:RNA polymerase sigma-70 factor (ECF subfamily)
MAISDLQPVVPATSADETALLARVALGDREAFRRLYSTYHRRLHRFLHRLTRERELSEEVINDTMMVVWQNAASFRGASRASTWILGIAYRRALKALERNRAANREQTSLAVAAVLDLAAPDALSQGAELDNWIDAALGQLSAEHRLVIELAYFLGLSCEEIAEVASCPVGTVKTRMFYARARLREALRVLAGPRHTGEEFPP